MGKTVLIKNLTPRLIVVCSPEGTPLGTIPPEQVSARCTARSVPLDQIIGWSAVPININRTIFGTVENLPDEEENVYLIVSRVVAQACPNRSDLLITDQTILDNEGHIIGYVSFTRV